MDHMPLCSTTGGLGGSLRPLFEKVVVLVRSRRFLAQGAVDDATCRFSTPEFLHIAVWAGKRNLTSFSNPARHQTDIMLATHRRGHGLTLCQ